MYIQFYILDKDKLEQEQADGPLRKQFKAQYAEDWENELRQWRAKMAEIAQPTVANSYILPHEYDQWLTPEQNDFVGMAIDHEKWLIESSKFRLMVQYILGVQEHSNYLKSHYERTIMEIVERRALQFYTNNFTVGKIIINDRE